MRPLSDTPPPALLPRIEDEGDLRTASASFAVSIPAYPMLPLPPPSPRAQVTDELFSEIAEEVADEENNNENSDADGEADIAEHTGTVSDLRELNIMLVLMPGCCAEVPQQQMAVGP
eukprot:SM003055S11839  [mRNA]  locus=s3055:50:521:- [translate_table: standard]